MAADHNMDVEICMLCVSQALLNMKKAEICWRIIYEPQLSHVPLQIQVGIHHCFRMLIWQIDVLRKRRILRTLFRLF